MLVMGFRQQWVGVWAQHIGVEAAVGWGSVPGLQWGFRFTGSLGFRIEPGVGPAHEQWDAGPPPLVILSCYGGVVIC